MERPRRALWVLPIVLIVLTVPPATARGAAPPAEPQPVALAPLPGKALTLGDLEAMALRGNPTLAQAAAQVAASRGKAPQAGLYPNPTVGYVGDQMGAEGTAGELQGGFVQQTIVTAGKLRLSRAKYGQEAREAEIRAVGQQ